MILVSSFNNLVVLLNVSMFYMTTENTATFHKMNGKTRYYGNTWHYSEHLHYSLLASCLLACILIAYWLFINTYKAHIEALFCMSIF